MNDPAHTPVERVSWAAARARRLARHSLTAPAPGGDPAAVAAALCGAHAQVLSAAELSLAMRLPGATRRDVQHALWTRRTLVKTYGPRGTVHLLPSRDLPLWTGALTALRAATAATGRSDPTGTGGLLTPARTDEVVEAVADALADAELTADELTEEVVARTGPWAGEPVMEAFQGKWARWRSATAVAAHRGALCFGPNRGRRVTYTNPHRWLPGFVPDDGASATDEVVRRYLHSYGPATPQHFAQWMAAPRRWAAGVFESLAARGELRPVELAGTPAWVLASDPDFPATPDDPEPASTSAEAPDALRLLPYFDAYSVGSHPRERVFPGRAAERALAAGQAGNFPVLLIDGMAAGVWHQRRSGRTIQLTVEPLGELSRAQHAALAAQAEQLGRVMEGSVRLTVGPVTVGPHA